MKSALKNFAKKTQTQLQNLLARQILFFPDLREFCIHINARCRVVSQTGPELLTDPYFDLKDEGSKILADMSKYLEKKIEISILETNNLRGIYIVKKLVDGTYIEIFEHDYVNMTWNLNLGYFSKSTYFVTFFWLVFLFALIPIHSLRRESK